MSTEQPVEPKPEGVSEEEMQEVLNEIQENKEPEQVEPPPVADSTNIVGEESILPLMEEDTIKRLATSMALVDDKTKKLFKLRPDM